MKDILIKFAKGLSGTGSITPVKPEENSTVTSNDLTNNVREIINVVIGVLGIIAVVVIILGGVQYMTSSGDAGKVKKAKDTILYGVIGLIVVALSFAIVNFVIMGILGNK